MHERKKYLTFNAALLLIAALLSGIMMAESGSYTYMFLLIVSGIVGLRDAVAATLIGE